MIHHYITKYWEDGKHYAEAWLQLNLFGYCICFSKRKMVLEENEAVRDLMDLIERTRAEMNVCMGDVIEHINEHIK